MRYTVHVSDPLIKWAEVKYDPPTVSYKNEYCEVLEEENEEEEKREGKIINGQVM